MKALPLAPTNTPTNAGAGSRIASMLTRRIQRWADAIDEAPPTYRHRMGAWELSVSSSAQAALHAMRAQAVQKA